MHVLDRVRRTIREHDLIRTGMRVTAGVSGGSDSVALAEVLGDLDAAGELTFAGLVHFNHQLREAADEDERFVARLAARLGRPLIVERGDVGGRARRERRSIEDAARAARYECFARARVELRAECVALGHTRDDQAETFLLRLLRGAGPRGLAGMHPRNGAIVRPLLDCRRAELREWLADRGVEFVEDPSNRDVAIPRNRVRAELLPLLESRFNPAVVDALASGAGLAREAWEAVGFAADEIAGRIVQTIDDGHRVIDVDGLLRMPLALRRVVVWRAMSDAAAGRPVGSTHVAAALRLIARGGDGVVDAPGHRVERIGHRVVLKAGTRARTRIAGGEPNLFDYPLSIPGRVAIAEARCVVSAETVEGGVPAAVDRGAIVGNGRAALVAAAACGPRLSVRNRRPGDRFRPVGLGGRRTLQNLFVDRKVPRADRDAVPIVVDADGRIVWVAGFGIDEAFRVPEPPQAVLLLRLTPVGGSA